jgi:aminopeptidase N
MGTQKHWNFLYQRYRKSNVATERIVISIALACSPKQWLLNRYLDWSLNSSLIHNEDAEVIFDSIAREENGFYLARNFFFERFDDIYQA